MLICYKLVTIVSVILLITTHASSQPPELSSTLYSTISGEFVAFSNENITFTCIVRGSNAIEWSSDDYIGTGGRRLEFISTDRPGSQLNAGETLATLVRATQDIIIESQLNIRIQSTISVATVRCQNGGTGENTEITFHLAGNDTSVLCDRRSACPDETINCVCATGNSNALAWVINRLEFTSNDPLQTRRSVNALGILTNRHSDNRIPVISSNLTVTASIDDTNVMIQCENVDGSTLNAFPINISQSCPDPSERVTTPAGDEAASATDCGGSIAAAAVVPAFIIIIIAIVVVVVLFLAYKNYLQKKYDDKKSTLQEEYNNKQNDLDQQQQNLNDKENKMKNEVASLQQQLESARSANTRLQNKNQSLEQKENEMKNEVASLQQQLESARSTNTRLQNKNQSLEQKKLELQQAGRSLEQKLRDANNEKHELQQQVGSLKQELHDANNKVGEQEL